MARWQILAAVTAVLLLLVAASGSSLGNGACPPLMGRLKSIRWWCVEKRRPSHIVNTVRACIQRSGFTRDVSRTWRAEEEVLIGLSSKYLPSDVDVSTWTVCHAHNDAWYGASEAYFGTITLEDEDEGKQDYRLWYATSNVRRCWESSAKKHHQRIAAGEKTEPYLYECDKCAFHDSESDSKEDDNEYSYVRGFNSTVYLRRKCKWAKEPYVPALYRVRRELSECKGCRIWSEARAADTVYMGRCGAESLNGTLWPKTRPGQSVTISGLTRECKVNESVAYWAELKKPALDADKAMVAIPLAKEARARAPAQGGVGVQQAVAALDPDNFAPGTSRAAADLPEPATMLSCLDTVLAGSPALTPQQISQSLKGFEMYIAKVKLGGTGRTTTRLSMRGSRASLLVAEQIQGALVSADSGGVMALDNQQDGWSATSLSARSDVTAAVLVSEVPGRLAFTHFRQSGLGLAFQQQGYIVNSDVISVQVVNSSGEGPGYVDIVLKPNNSRIRRRCGLWDLDQNIWDFSLCSLEYRGEVSDVCRCRHLTHFAQLVTDGDLQWGRHAAPLEALSLAGVVASLLGAAGLGAAAAMEPEWRRKPGSRVLLQLGGAVAARDLLFALVTLGGMEWWQPRASAGCVALGVLLHYALLAAAAWTTAAAVLQLLRLSTVAGAQARVPHLVLVCSSCSWLAPLFPVLILLAASGPTAGYPLRQDSASDFLCYPQGAAFYAAVLLPMVLCTVVNAAIFLYLMVTVLFPPCQGDSTLAVARHGSSQLRRRVLTATMLFFLLGLPWILGPPAREPALAYLFCIVATPQGLVLFVFFVLCNTKLRKRLSSAVLTSLPTSSSSATGSTRKRTKPVPSAENGARSRSPPTSSTSAPSGSASASASAVRSRQRAPAVVLTRYALVAEDGRVRHTFDLGAWSPDDGNPTDPAYMPGAAARRSLTKYVFPEVDGDGEEGDGGDSPAAESEPEEGARQ